MSTLSIALFRKEVTNCFEEISVVVRRVVECLDDADYEVKQLALTALDFRVILYSDNTYNRNDTNKDVTV